MADTNQDDLKLQTKLWLKANNRGYAWFAELCSVSESTVRNWMARKPIPQSKAQIIRNTIHYMSLNLPEKTIPPIRVCEETCISLQLDSVTRRTLEKYAALQNKSLETFLSEEITKLIQ